MRVQIAAILVGLLFAVWVMGSLAAVPEQLRYQPETNAVPVALEEVR